MIGVASVHIFPHAPQLKKSPFVLTAASQPVVMTPSVSQYPELQLAIPHVPPLHDGVPLVTVHTPVVPHWPVESQVCTVRPEHCFEPGEQTPVQLPSTHAWLVQAAVEPHWPVPSQVSTLFPEHCFDPGTQTPRQLPNEHTNGHVLPLCHVPVESQVCASFPTHCAEVGTQDPVQAPEVQR